MAITPMSVLTEFKFEIGSALLATDTLTGKVDGLTDSIDGMLAKTQNLGISFAANLGFGGGFIGLAANAIRASEAFDEVSRGFSTILSSNKENFTGTIDTFNDRLMTSGVIIRDLVKDARKFGIDEKSLIESTKLMGAALAPKGLAGKNFEVPRELSRNLLKSAPILGINPRDVEGQLLRTIGGQSSMGDTLFRRLAAETQAFQPFNKKGGTQDFNILPAAKRVELLRTALGQFTSDTEVLDDRLNSLSNQMTITKSIIFGIDGIFKKLGDTLKRPMVLAMRELNRVLMDQGERIVGNFNTIISSMLSDPKKLIVGLFQVRQVSEDIRRSGEALGRAGIGATIGALLTRFVGVGRYASGLGAAFGFLSSLFEKFASGIIPDLVAKMGAAGMKMLAVISIVGAVLAKFGVLGATLAFLGAALNLVVIPAIALFGVFQLISRAIAIARVNDAAILPELMARASDAITRIIEAGRKLAQPFIMLFDFLANLISPMFSASFAGNRLVGVIELVADGMEGLISVMMGVGATQAGLADALGTFIAEMSTNFIDGVLGLGKNIAMVVAEVLGNVPTAIMDLMTGTDLKDIKLLDGDVMNRLLAGEAAKLKFGAESIAQAFNDGFNEYLAQNLRPPEQGGQAFVNNVTNIDKVTISNEFKEQQEPDRVAFTIKDQLMKAAQNPTGAYGRSLAGGLVGS